MWSTTDVAATGSATETPAAESPRKSGSRLFFQGMSRSNVLRRVLDAGFGYAALAESDVMGGVLDEGLDRVTGELGTLGRALEGPLVQDYDNEGRPMTTEPKVGDRVSWTSEAG
jgi:hypothetical protein